MIDEKTPGKNQFLYVLTPEREVVLAENTRQWADFLEERSGPVVVAQTELAQGVTVSTIFTGVSSAWRATNYPRPFETMVFGGKYDMEQYRWGRWDEAEAGHQAVVDKVSAAIAFSE